MNKLIKESIEEYFFSSDVIIEDKNEKTWNKQGISISLKDNQMKYVSMLLSNGKYDWYIFFENETKKDMTDNENFTLLNAISNVAKKDDLITLYGNIKPYDIIMINKLRMHGFIVDGYNKAGIKWDDNIDEKNFNEWIQHADERLYTIIDKNMLPTIHNTKPVCPVLKKI